MAIATAGEGEFDCCRADHVCTRPPVLTRYLMPDGTRGTVCPWLLVGEREWTLLRLYQLYQQGQYPSPGGLLDQTAYYLDAMAVVGYWYHQEARVRHAEGRTVGSTGG